MRPQISSAAGGAWPGGLRSSFLPPVAAPLLPLLRTILLPPLTFAYLLLLFRLLATTADSYLAPSLESFSFELGLPPRLAGATPLALGNGAPDLGSTVDAILLWSGDDDDGEDRDKNGGGGGGEWAMSLGSLAGGGMFVGAVVCALLVRECGGVACRWAFLRDVGMYATSVAVVWSRLEKGRVTANDARLFLGMYLAYVAVVFLSDVYHRKVTLRRLRGEARERRRSVRERNRRLSQVVKESRMAAFHECTPLVESMESLRSGSGGRVDGNDGEYGTAEGRGNVNFADAENPGVPCAPPGGADPLPPERDGPSLSRTDRFAMLMSNYDPKSVKYLRDKNDNNGPSSFATGSTTSSCCSGYGCDDDDEGSEWNEVHRAIHAARAESHAGGIYASFRERFGQHDGDVVAASSTRIGEPPPPPVPTLAQSSEPAVVSEEPAREVDDGDDDGPKPPSGSLLGEAVKEIAFLCKHCIRDCSEEGRPVFDRVMAFVELPISAARAMTVPIPCEEHYCRPLLVSWGPLASF